MDSLLTNIVDHGFEVAKVTVAREAKNAAANFNSNQKVQEPHSKAGGLILQSIVSLFIDMVDSVLITPKSILRASNGI